MIPAYFMANIHGIPRIESTGVVVGTENVTFSFRSHNFLRRPFNGIVLVRLNQPIPTGTATDLPIVFNSGGTNSQTVTTYNGVDLTVADFAGTGVYLFYYDSASGTLQLIGG
jgi:hypothetical protein